MSFLTKIKRSVLPGVHFTTRADDGLLLIDDENFRAAAAVFEDGRLYVASGYFSTAEVQQVLSPLATQLGVSDWHVIEASLEEIDNIYEGTGREALFETDKLSVKQKLEALMARAAKIKASDIEIIQGNSKTTLLLRVAGKTLRLEEEWTSEDGLAAIRHAFDAREGGGAETTMAASEFQSFAIAPGSGLKFPERLAKLRGQKGHHENRTGMGNHLVMRNLYDDTEGHTGALEELGLDDDVMTELKREMRVDQGCVVIGGTTGNGKSTTIINLINRIFEDRDGRVSIVTFEDPVEMRACSPEIKQIPVLSKGDQEELSEAWGKALKHLMRINPDIGVVGEMRDGASAEEVLRFVASGHKVLTTLHVGSVNSIPFRLTNWGVSPAEVASETALSLMLRQILVPKLCNGCKAACSEEEIDEIADTIFETTGTSMPKLELKAKLAARLNARNRSGCPSCLGENGDPERKIAWGGLERMIAVAEFIRPDETYRQAIRDNNSEAARNHWLTAKSEGGLGGVTADMRLARKVLAGDVAFWDAKKSEPSLEARVMDLLERADA
jgi:type II secretory ATPase GspE/PulE/Tfp pilus assembly ATPase PilB-like protein